MKLFKITILIAFLFTFIGVNAQNEVVDTTNQEVFFTLEDQPEYVGGDEARLEFLGNNIIYPKSAKKKGIQGTVYVTFVVEKDGSISNVNILRGIGGGCDEAVVKAIKQMPKWKPGSQEGKAVRAQFNMPVKFILDDSVKKKARKEKRALKKKQKAEAKAKKE